jgi:predicted nuclease of predicted toxin-antitoxin system
MKLLFDQNLSVHLCRLLSDLYPDSEQVRRLGLDQAGDEEIWSYARVHGFTILTQDADFADLSALRGSPPKVIWLRCGNQRTETIERIIRDHALEILILESSDDLSCLELR